MNLARRILEGIHEVELQVTPEFQKPEEPSGQKLMDLIKEYVKMGVISIDDVDEVPSDSNPVGFPGDVVEYTFGHDAKLFGAVHERVQKSGMHWAWNGPHRRFYLSPGPDMNVPVFRNRVYNLVSWFIEQPGVGAPTPKEDDE